MLSEEILILPARSLNRKLEKLNNSAIGLSRAVLAINFTNHETDPLSIATLIENNNVFVWTLGRGGWTKEKLSVKKSINTDRSAIIDIVIPEDGTTYRLNNAGGDQNRIEYRVEINPKWNPEMAK